MTDRDAEDPRQPGDPLPQDISPSPGPSDPREAFFTRAQEEAARYGDDSWVFLRELVQNGRDARARRIEFRVDSDATTETITCIDDGQGMDLEAVSRYLLRLYASTKGDNGSIGFFGVGFWSILRFAPRTVQVFSAGLRGGAGVEIDCRARTIRVVPAAHFGTGTTVILTRRVGDGPLPPGGLQARVRERLEHYAAHLRPFPGEPAVELVLNGERLHREFPMPPLGGCRLKGSGFDAVVGFGPEPSVRIYAGGILVRDLRTLDEVLPSQGVAAPRGGWGLYPVVRINGDGFRLLMDRQTVYEDQVLITALRQCERALITSHERLVRGLLPMNLTNWWWWTWHRMQSLIMPLGVGAALVCIAALTVPRIIPGGCRGTARLPRIGPPGRLEVLERAGLRPVDEIGPGLQGPRRAATETNGAKTAWDLSHDGPSGTLFVVRFLSAYDPHEGFQTQPVQLVGAYPDYPDTGRQSIRVSCAVSEGTGLLPLPLPAGHVVVRRSLRYDGVQPSLWTGEFGEPVIRVSTPGRISYTTMAHRAAVSCRQATAPEIVWTGPFSAALADAAHGNLDTRLAALLRPARAAFRYEWGRGPAPGEEPWIERVMAAGSGDCDILNGVVVLLLRSAGFDAHLAIAMVGQATYGEPMLHAVAAFCHEGWQFVDVSGETPGVDRAPGSLGPAAGAAPETLGSQSRHVVLTSAAWLLGGALGALLVMAGVAVMRLRGRQLPDPLHVRSLFDHAQGARAGRGNDLRYRPVVPLLNGRRVSLAELLRWAAHGSLLGASPSAPLLPYIRSSRVIDRSKEVVGLLAPYLPPITWLDDLGFLMVARHADGVMQGVENLFRVADRCLRIHVVPGSDEVRWVDVPLKGDGGRRHVLVGDRHRLCAEMLNAARSGEEGVIRAAALLLEVVPLYLYQDERLRRMVSLYGTGASLGENEAAPPPAGLRGAP